MSVSSWDDVARIWSIDGAELSAARHLAAPGDLCADTCSATPQLDAWWQEARQYVSDSVSIPPSPDFLQQELDEMLFEYVFQQGVTDIPCKR